MPRVMEHMQLTFVCMCPELRISSSELFTTYWCCLLHLSKCR